ncbi:MAG TPA: hypothetical protein DER56_01935 [Thermosipho africanus]|nr:hypothetical protein [Thermosipho africanus]
MIKRRKALREKVLSEKIQEIGVLKDITEICDHVAVEVESELEALIRDIEIDPLMRADTISQRLSEIMQSVSIIHLVT